MSAGGKEEAFLIPQLLHATITVGGGHLSNPLERSFMLKPKISYKSWLDFISVDVNMEITSTLI